MYILHFTLMVSIFGYNKKNLLYEVDFKAFLAIYVRAYFYRFFRLTIKIQDLVITVPKLSQFQVLVI